MTVVMPDVAPDRRAMERRLSIRIAASGVGLAVAAFSSFSSWDTGRFVPIVIVNALGLASIAFAHRIEPALLRLPGEAYDGGFEP